MRIAYVLSQYPARSETFIAREMQELSSQGNDLTIARLRWSDTNAGMGVSGAEVLSLKWNPIEWMLGVQWAARKAPRSLGRIGRDLLVAARPSLTWVRLLLLGLISLALARTLSNKSVEHVRAHFLDSEAIAAFWISRLLGVPFSLTLHTLEVRFSPSLLKDIVENAAFCAVISEDVKGRLLETAARPTEVVLIRNGVRLPEECPFAFPSSPPTWRLLAVGRLVEKKGFDVLLKACAHLFSRGCSFRCTLIGDGPLLDSLRAQARNLNVAHRVAFRGAESNEVVLRAMQQHDVLVMPSRPARDGTRDGIPTVLMEALSHGMPVVASNFAGIPELVEDGVTGRLVPPNDSVALARALHHMFDHPQQASAMAKAGRERVRRRFNLAYETQRLNTLIRESA